MNFSLYLAAGLLAATTFTACNNSTATNSDAQPQTVSVSDSMMHLIRLDRAYTTDVQDLVKVTGSVAFNDRKVVKVYPFSSGQLVQVLVSLGDKVRKGQTLAVIRSADVAGNYSDLQVAQNDVAIAKKQTDNAAALYKSGIASEREYIEAKENYAKALAESHKISEQIAINGGGHTSPNGTYLVKAPLDGYVVEKNAEQGGFIRTDNSQNLFTIGDISEVWIWANVYETDVAKVKEGYTAKVHTLAYPAREFSGVVDKANEVLDPNTKAMQVRISLRNDSLLLKPQMFADINIENEQRNKMVAIPASGIIADNGKTLVVVYHNRNSLELRPVTVLKTVNDIAYIASGLAAGDTVVSKNQVLLYKALLDAGS